MRASTAIPATTRPRLTGRDQASAAWRVGLKIFWLGILLTVGALAPFSANAQKVVGSAVGTTHASLPGVSGEIPLLGPFQLAFYEDDHHIKKIAVWPNQVDSNSALLDTVTLSFRDKKPTSFFGDDDKFHYFARFYLGPLFGAQLLETGAHTLGALATFALPPRPHAASIFALVGFSIEFECDDHHISRVVVREEGGNLSIGMQDEHDGWREGCDAFSYNVMYTWLHPLDVFGSGTQSGASPDLPPLITTHGGQIIVRGFDFRVNVPGKDQHLAFLGVTDHDFSSVNRFRLVPEFTDKHGVDGLPFDWTIDWAEVGPRYLPPPRPLLEIDPTLLRDAEDAQENAAEWMRRRQLRISQ